MTGKGELYYDFFSQPSRAVLSLLELIGLTDQVELKESPVATGYLRTPEFTKFNPNQKVPFYKDSDVSLFESGAIMKYLCAQYLPANDPMYPRHNPQATAQVESALLVYHKCVRFSARYFYGAVLAQLNGVEHLFDMKEEAAKAYMICKLLDIWLSEHGGRMVTTGLWTIADILVFHEIMNLHLAEDFSVNNKKLPHLLKFLRDFAKTKGIGTSVTKLREGLEDAEKNVAYVYE